MTNRYLYFQPQYVREFVCDGSKCPNNCCRRNWKIEVDRSTYARYANLKPELLDLLSRDDATGKFYMRQHPCPLLTDGGLCSLQLEHGEEFLSLVCRTYPRQTFSFGNFFERSLSLTCPLAAEMILFTDEPLGFELVEVSEKVHGGKIILIDEMHVPESLFARVVEIQIAMISILQRRTLSIDQRLIVLGFFLDRLDEIISGGLDFDALTKLIAAYESKSFLSEQVPRMFASVNFNAKNFIGRMLSLFEKFFIVGIDVESKKFSDALIKTFDIVPDEHIQVSATKIAANYLRLADARKNFTARHATLMENFLVNELFANCVPWRNEATVAQNFGLFVAAYKVFEMFVFAAAQENLFGKNELLQLVDLVTSRTNHSSKLLHEHFLNCFKDANDMFSLLETFLEGRFKSDGTVDAPRRCD